jgi:antitoxin CcdA
MTALRHSSHHHPLDIWIAAQGKTRAWAASYLQTTEASLSRIINGKRWPSRQFFERVEALTSGQITAEHFVSPKKQCKPSLPLSDAAAEPGRKRVRVHIAEELLAEAAELGVDVNVFAENLLRERIKQERIKRWQVEHADLIAWYNEHIEKDGIFGEEWRTF